MNIQKYKELLEGEKARLEEELARISTPNPENPNDWDAMPEEDTVKEADLNVAADMHEEVEERHGTSDVLEERLEEVNDALVRIEEDTYGVCEECGKPIDEDRLEANPAAAACKEHMN